MIKIKVVSNSASSGALELVKFLRENLKYKASKISLSSTSFIPSKNDLIVNWGSSKLPDWLARTKVKSALKVLNLPEYIEVAVNKYTTFKILSANNVNVPEFSYRSGVIPSWDKTVVRKLLQSKAGAGIELVTKKEYHMKEDIFHSYLVTEYIKKTKEYRVHVFDGKVIDVQEKRKEKDFPSLNYQIRTRANGWVFCREDINPPEKVLSEAVAAVAALNLDFGAVDIIWNRHHDKAYVLEVNTAPGIEGTTIESYANAISQYVNELED